MGEGIEEDQKHLKKGHVNIQSLKKWARTTLSPNSTLKQLILLENDEINANDFLNKLDAWLKISSIETGKK